jgi:hypothetical protein
LLLDYHFRSSFKYDATIKRRRRRKQVANAMAHCRDLSLRDPGRNQQFFNAIGPLLRQRLIVPVIAVRTGEAMHREMSLGSVFLKVLLDLGQSIQKMTMESPASASFRNSIESN